MPRMTLECDTGNWLKFCPKCCEIYRALADGYFEALEIIKEHFPVCNNGTDDGLSTYCFSCSNNERKGRQLHERRDIMLKNQEGKCGICLNEVSFKNRTAQVDHCHTSGINRKILCNSCNTRMIGVDDDRWLAKAIAYRDSYRK